MCYPHILPKRAEQKTETNRHLAAHGERCRTDEGPEERVSSFSGDQVSRKSQ